MRQFGGAIYPSVMQKVAYTATHAQSAAFNASTNLIRVVATTACHVAFGANPTAVADGTGTYLPAGVPCFFKVVAGQKVSAIRDSGDGSLYITETKIDS